MPRFRSQHHELKVGTVPSIYRPPVLPAEIVNRVMLNSAFFQCQSRPEANWRKCGYQLPFVGNSVDDAFYFC